MIKLLRTAEELGALIGKKEAEVVKVKVEGKMEYHVYQHDAHVASLTKEAYDEILGECE